MKRRSKVLLGVVLLIVILIIMSVVQGGGDDSTEVRIADVQARDLVATVTASGRLSAKRSVDVSSDITGRVVALAVEEGDDVRRGQLLLRIDPTQYEAAVSRAEALLSGARASEVQARANFQQAERALNRAQELRNTSASLISDEALETARTNHEVAGATLQAQQHQVSQAEASLAEARDQLSKTTIVAPMDGKVTRLAVEEGEVALASTFNRETGLLMTISDLSEIKVDVEVDETDVVRLSVGDSAEVTIDAFPNQTFVGRVTKVSQSAIQTAAAQASSDQAVDFDVEVTLVSPPGGVRPDLSATARIITDTRTQTLSIPIIALTVREYRPISTENQPADTTLTETEGVFVVRGGVAHFTPVTVGIAGEEYFEVVAGLAAGDSIVAGPYQTIRDLTDSTAVRQSGTETAETQGR